MYQIWKTQSARDTKVIIDLKRKLKNKQGKLKVYEIMLQFNRQHEKLKAQKW